MYFVCVNVYTFHKMSLYDTVQKSNEICLSTRQNIALDSQQFINNTYYSYWFYEQTIAYTFTSLLTYMGCEYWCSFFCAVIMNSTCASTNAYRCLCKCVSVPLQMRTCANTYMCLYKCVPVSL